MKYTLLIFLALLGSLTLKARENAGTQKRMNERNLILAACTSPLAQTDLDINNVRTTILTGGDMWWDLTNPKYEIPKGSGIHSIFSGALWIGGIDAGSQLRVAAMTYRQTGKDFWPGPLDPSTASTNSSTVCSNYDKHWRITRQEVSTFISSGTATSTITSWPAFSVFGQPLAPFYDANSDGVYDPSAGDYPDYDFTGTASCDDKLFGDQTLFWVFNDKGNGNTHTETGGQPIGLEIQAQAFSYLTSDALNDATFYKYKIINRSTLTLNNTYFGQWTDTDLGYAFDDYVGCDVSRGVGYSYNGANSDGTGSPGQYGSNPPAIGIDFFEGPRADNNGMDDTINPSIPGSLSGIGFGDGIIDNERLGMSKFVYYSNNYTPQGNPSSALDYYNYLKGFWKDSSPLNYGGDGYQESSAIACNFMFPGSSDPSGFGTNGIPQSAWDEFTVPNPPGDRRFLQSAGPFTLQPGAINYVTLGVVWARATSGGPLASLQKMLTADDLAQSVFASCFTNVASVSDSKEKNEELVLYPNPFSEFAIISLKQGIFDQVQLDIFNTMGQKVSSSISENCNSIQINKSKLANGTYFYKLSDSKGKKYSGKFIVN